MKILLLGNAESVHVQKWAKYFKKENMDIHIASLIFANIKDINVYKLLSSSYEKRTDNNNYNRKKVLIEVYKQIKKIIFYLKPDIISAHYASSYGLMGAMQNYHPFCISVWGSDILTFPRQNFINRIAIKYTLSKADCICATSNYLKKEIHKYCKKHVVVTPFGVDTNLYRKREFFLSDFQNSKVPLKKNPFIIGIVKSLEKVYGIEYLIKALSIVKKKIPNISLWIAGSGSQEYYLKNIALKMDLGENITFLGKVRHEYVPILLNQLDVMIIPSIQESFGVSAVEAASVGIPVIASNTPGLSETVIDGHTGFLVESKRPDLIADKILYLYHNEHIREEMGNNARQFVLNNFSWYENALIMKNLFESMVK